MDFASALSLADKLLKEHNLYRQGWRFSFNNAKRSLGKCHYGHKRIELSKHHVKHSSDAAIEDTLLHEIAHAIAGAHAKHGPKWREACVRIGATPKATTRAPEMPNGKWSAICPDCKKTHHRHRKPAKYLQYFCKCEHQDNSKTPLVFSCENL